MCLPLQQAMIAGSENALEKERLRWAALEAGMSAFVEGGLVTRKLMKPLEPKKFENWEFKQRKPKPGLRVFGSFAKPDVFVGTHVKDRNGLGGMNSQEFEFERLDSEQFWKKAGLPLREDGRPDCFTDPEFRYEAYITDNAREKVSIP